MHVLGLDIGGANLKAAHTAGPAKTQMFPLWKNPDSLANELARFVEDLPSWDVVAATMTGELCDCFVSQAEGVRHILRALAELARPRPIRVWSLEGRFVTWAEAHERPDRVGAANWLAQATLVARQTATSSGLLIDMGTTTTDIVAFKNGSPATDALRDIDRLAAHELVYTGASRTPVCAVLGMEVAAEFFATMADVYVVLGAVPEEPDRRDTADGRPLTLAHAHARLARMLCADPATCPRDVTLRLAQRAEQAQTKRLSLALENVAHQRLGRRPDLVYLSGSGAAILARLLASERSVPRVQIATQWGQARATAACAWAVAALALTETI